MCKIIVTEFISLDGVVEAPGGNETDHPHRGWQFLYGSPASTQYKIEELASAGTLLLGRKTYEQFAGFWPGQQGGGFADRINRYPKYVVSESLQEAKWNNSHLIRDLKEEVTALKKTGSADILVYGSATLVRSLLHHNLIDELHLMLFPVALGGGQRLFAEELELKKFELKDSRVFDKGVILLEYLPIRFS